METAVSLALPQDEMLSKLVLMLTHFLAEQKVIASTNARGTVGLFREVPTSGGPHNQYLCWIEPEKKGRLILGYEGRTPASLRAALEPWMQKLVAERGGTEKHDGEGFVARWPMPLKVAPADVAGWIREALDIIDRVLSEKGGTVEAPSGPPPVDRAPRVKTADGTTAARGKSAAAGEGGPRPRTRAADAGDGATTTARPPRSTTPRKPEVPALSPEALASIRKGEKCPGCGRTVIDEKAHRRCLAGA